MSSVSSGWARRMTHGRGGGIRVTDDTRTRRRRVRAGCSRRKGSTRRGVHRQRRLGKGAADDRRTRVRHGAAPCAGTRAARGLAGHVPAAGPVSCSCGAAGARRRRGAGADSWTRDARRETRFIRDERPPMSAHQAGIGSWGQVHDPRRRLSPVGGGPRLRYRRLNDAARWRRRPRHARA